MALFVIAGDWDPGPAQYLWARGRGSSGTTTSPTPLPRFGCGLGQSACAVLLSDRDTEKAAKTAQC